MGDSDNSQVSGNKILSIVSATPSILQAPTQVRSLLSGSLLEILSYPIDTISVANRSICARIDNNITLIDISVYELLEEVDDTIEHNMVILWDIPNEPLQNALDYENIQYVPLLSNTLLQDDSDRSVISNSRNMVHGFVSYHVLSNNDRNNFLLHSS